MAARGAVLLALCYGILPGVQTWLYLAGLPFADGPDVLNYSASIVAYHWMLANVLLGLKLPFLQNSLPYDARIRFHVWTSLGLTVFLAWHALYTIFLKTKIIDVVSWSLLVLFSVFLFLSILWIPLPGLKTLRTKLISLLQWTLVKSYDGLKALHKVLFFLLAGLSYVHILQAEIVGLVPPAAGWAYHGLFVLTVAAFLWTRIRNLTLPSLEVREVVNSGGIVRLALAPHPRLKYRGGQFAFLRFDHPDLRGEEHPFSFTSARHEEGVGFAIRALGDFTTRLVRLKPGDRVRVNAGFGAFHPSHDHRPLALIGSGIGAAPLVSILKEVAQGDPEREVVCLLSVNEREEMIEARALENLTRTMPRLRLKVFVFDEDGQLYNRDLFARELGNPTDFDYYLCSSDKVRRVVIEALQSLGVKPHKIHFEAFNLAG